LRLSWRWHCRQGFELLVIIGSTPRWLVKAIHEMRDALKELREAPDDFGGNKAAAIRDTEQAIHSLKKALYFRLKMDDAALDRAE
jgi:hypothetical protein